MKKWSIGTYLNAFMYLIQQIDPTENLTLIDGKKKVFAFKK